MLRPRVDLILSKMSGVLGLPEAPALRISRPLCLPPALDTTLLMLMDLKTRNLCVRYLESGEGEEVATKLQKNVEGNP